MTVRKPWTPRLTESVRHRELVLELQTGGALVGGFRRATEAVVGAAGGCTFVEAPIVPDAYGFNRARQVVFVYEVCVAHWITGKKRAAVRAWAKWLAAHGWSIRLIKVNAAGGMVGIDPDSGELDADSLQRVADILAGRIDP